MAKFSDNVWRGRLGRGKIVLSFLSTIVTSHVALYFGLVGLFLKAPLMNLETSGFSPILSLVMSDRADL